MEVLIEIAKQVPALAVLAWLVHYFVAAFHTQAERSEARIVSITEAHATRLKEIITEYRRVAELSSGSSQRILELLISMQATLGRLVKPR